MQGERPETLLRDSRKEVALSQSFRSIHHFQHSLSSGHAFIIIKHHHIASFRQQHHQFMSYSATHIFAPVVEAQEAHPTSHQPCLASKWIRSSTTRSRRAVRSVLKISTYQTGVSTHVPVATRYTFNKSQEASRSLKMLTLIQICQFCYNNIKTTMNGLCPACRRVYNDEQIKWEAPSAEE